jgi:hypothetical protein
MFFASQKSFALSSVPEAAVELGRSLKRAVARNASLRSWWPAELALGLQECAQAGERHPVTLIWWSV